VFLTSEVKEGYKVLDHSGFDPMCEVFGLCVILCYHLKDNTILWNISSLSTGSSMFHRYELCATFVSVHIHSV
jgi:hypothetical protein